MDQEKTAYYFNLLDKHEKSTMICSVQSHMRSASTTYHEIIQIGEDIVPSIIQYMQEKGGGMNIMLLLWDILKLSPYTPEIVGGGFAGYNVEEAKNSWIKYWKDRKFIQDIIKPETDLERKIIYHPEFVHGTMWGKPRNGHPEGQVIFHIGDVLKNVDKYTRGLTRERLRLVAIVHDTFKYKVDRSKPKDGENHHAMIARRFAEKFITDKELLEIIELHDEAYLAWVKGDLKGKWDVAEARAKKLIERLGNLITLYLVFYECDNSTGDKTRDNFIWFKEMVYKYI